MRNKIIIFELNFKDKISSNEFYKLLHANTLNRAPVKIRI